MPDQRVPRQLFVGLGSFHGDDQLGWQLADQMEKLQLLPVRQAAVPPDLLLWLDGIDELFICDACQGNGAVGTIHRWEYCEQAKEIEEILPGVVSLRSTSSHHLGLAPVLQLASQLGILPRRVILWAVEADSFDAGQSMSAMLTAQLPGIVKQMVDEVSHA